ncbi:MAG TPA: RNB domain-containing ribonuclease [Terriglobia bacterium]|nr:RNB domain-containing ribonuclease [Terriglobia bacterium]
MLSLEGRIIEFLDAEQLHVAYVRRQDHDRLHVIDPRGRNLSVSGDRVVVVHRATAEGDFPAIARQISDKVSARQSEVDVELLWQSLGGTQREMQPAELAEIFFAEDSPEAASAVFRALSEDNVFFKRKGSQFLARSVEQVSTELTRRQRQREREQIRERTSSIISQLLKQKKAAIPSDAGPILDRIQNWLRYRTGDEVGGLLEEIAGPTRARDAAYEILARAGRIDTSLDRFLIMAGIETEFPHQLIDVTKQLAPFSHDEARFDYQNALAFTIDDEDTREVDDALSVVHRGAEIIVGIHIADVSAFVEKGDLLDVEAARRSSTIYLPATTVRMFPERLSTDLASLNSGSPRPAYTVEVRFDEQGHRLGYRIALTTVNVEKRFSYDESDRAFDAGNTSLQTLHRIAQQLHDERAARGAITFRRPELKIRITGGEIEIKKINNNSPSRFIVSEMMILANGLSADFASVNALPVIYRTQEPRDAVAIEEAPAVEALAFEKLRKTFKRSRLSLTPGLHSGLGLSAYTQASSPIRRYADLVTQRQFTSMLRGGAIPHGREELLRILVTAEAAEQEIRTIEDRSTNYWLLEYLSRYKKDEQLSAVVLDLKGNIEIEDFYLRGKVAAGNKLQPGEVVQVRIESIEPEKTEVRFRLV